MYQYIYWHAQVWVVLLVGIGSCVILALLMVIALRRSHISKVLTAIDPSLDTRPFFSLIRQQELYL
ncbi:MAG: hypothetical protein GFH27_549279n351 [Chloroflexi bacterium AL-W]|nr:hypothetical protein [Chloroflexi bacterium AL-N1]NOK65317.1 hypothetical protein [Chloroflexi bacterium AL-N10]NOK72418.1 hypothetical protein [Chloroflexi bacterium AL-N5]NOK79496.1 hypothetical protein [Chloroflexi bacterium AL-W]NOK87412.1 hypothetical protein [Chloroflexi bacterium AL-N15]